MPTGYTAKLVEKGQDFRSFVLTCARGMGACIMQRDDPLDEPPKHTTESDYYTRALEKAKADLATLQAMNPEQQVTHGTQIHREAIKHAYEWLAKEQAQNARLDEMAAQVRAWEPPTDDHDGLKDFMLDQIKISRQDTDYIERSIQEKEGKSAQTFFVEALSKAVRDVAYYTEELRKEAERTKARNDWIDRLYESLPSN